MSQQENYDIKKEAERIIERGETPSMEEIRRLMKKSGKSFVQIMKETKQLKKSMDQAREKAESEGKYLDEHAYLKAQMNQSPQKIYQP